MNNDKLTYFVNKEGILREDIFIITQSEFGVVLFYYGEDDGKEKGSSWFS